MNTIKKMAGLMFSIVGALTLAAVIVMSLGLEREVAGVTSASWRNSVRLVALDHLTFYTCSNEDNPDCERVDDYVYRVFSTHTATGTWPTSPHYPDEFPIKKELSQQWQFDEVYVLTYDYNGDKIDKVVSLEDYLVPRGCVIWRFFGDVVLDECRLLDGVP